MHDSTNSGRFYVDRTPGSSSARTGRWY